ncbi:MAG: flagellar basal-body MS-ring/collar protein FliF [Buchnera aphidicola (Eriosoma harunire)]
MDVNKSSNTNSQTSSNNDFMSNKNFFSYFSNPYRIFFILFIVGIIIIGSLSHFFQSHPYKTLYNNLTNVDGGAIITQLKQMNIPYKFTQDSGLLLVPENQVYEVRFRLAEIGLPKGGNVGFELLDKNQFGGSHYLEHINYYRALEGELARSILRIESIQDARVHISIPKESLFLNEKKQPSASIVVTLYRGRTLNEEQIRAIMHLVSSSVSGLSMKDISIIDELGHLLTHSNNGYSVINSSQLTYTKLLEDQYSNRIEKILTPLLGLGNIHATVTAKINFNSETRSEDKFHPNYDNQNKSIRSEQITHHSQIETDKSQKSVMHDHNMINSDSSKSNNTSSLNNHNEFFDSVNNDVKNNQSIISEEIPSQSNIQQDKIVNYELDHMISHVKVNIGDVKRLSVAVVVNYIKNKKGDLVPLSKKLLGQIKDLICEVIGYSQDRQDSVHVVNAKFFNNPVVKKIEPTKTNYVLSDNNVNEKHINIIDRIGNIVQKIIDRTMNYSVQNNINEFISKNFNKNMLFYSPIALFFMFILIIYYQYKIMKYKKNNKVLLSQSKLQNQLDTPNVELVKEEKVVLEDKNKNVHDDILNEENSDNIGNDKTKNDSRVAALMIQKWISGDK